MKTKSNRFKAIIGMVCVLALLFAATTMVSCEETESTATVEVWNNTDTSIKVEITDFGTAEIAARSNHAFEYDWKDEDTEITRTVKVYVSSQLAFSKAYTFSPSKTSILSWNGTTITGN